VSEASVDLGGLRFERGAHLLVERSLRAVAVGEAVAVTGGDDGLRVHLRAWARQRGHGYAERGGVPMVLRTDVALGRWRGAARAGGATAEGVAERASAQWGLAPRGATVEASTPTFGFTLDAKDDLWSDDAGRLYAQAAAAQWDPATTIPWGAPIEHPEAVEDAVVQVMTYLIENETAALVIPARFVAQMHPHFREVMQLLAVQAADEARHIEVFTRRALLRRDALGLSTAGGQASLKTLVDEPDFATASFLLSVLGEGTFLSLLAFLRERGPDLVTREVARWSGQDEARHVAFGMAHLARHIERDPSVRERLAAAVTRRHDALQHTAGLNEEVFDALVLLAAGGWAPEAIGAGHDAVLALQRDMDESRQKRLRRLGFDARDAEALSSLHTRNFM
jgi:hypothetical protein